MTSGTGSHLHANVLATLQSWTPPDFHQVALREAYLAFLMARDDACERSCTPGHITASTVVLSADGTRTLLTLHPRVGLWCQLGGHLEPDDVTLSEAALREATEESGIEELVLDPVPLSLDVHPFTCKGSPPTRHFDVRYLAVAHERARPIISDESDDLRFFPLCALPEAVDPGLVHTIAQAVARFRA